MLKNGISLILISIFSTCFLPAQDKLPESWHGIWKGKLEIYNSKGLSQTVPMELHISPVPGSNKLTYTMIYGEGEQAQTRPYFLIAVDPAQGHYQVDEGNAILLDDFLLGGKFYSRFAVEGILLQSSMELRGKQLIYEITSGNITPLNTTGDTKINGEKIPAVQSYGIRSMQRAVLKRQGPENGKKGRM